ncbi:MAG TPA: alpha/beta fold hydrolase, partial [Chloroflexota bacterium]|nr:alpha/beta fold hydrolase [Chloroflexota bacterium]
MIHEEGTIKGPGNVSLYYQMWRPEGTPRATLVIAHGLGEHSGRYMNVVNHLVPKGYGIYALDHLGHGRSPGQRG